MKILGVSASPRKNRREEALMSPFMKGIRHKDCINLYVNFCI